MRSQAEGVAEALDRPFESVVVRLRAPWSWLPAHRQPPGLLRYGLEGRLPQPWPDVLISCGRRSAPVSVAVRRAGGGRTFTVHVQNPLTPLRCFDLVVPMEHDGLAGPNVVATRAALHGITPQKLAAAGAEWRERLGGLNVAVMLGGRSRSHRFTRETLDMLASGLAGLEGDIAVAPSRRTQPDVVECAQGPPAAGVVLGRHRRQSLPRHARIGAPCRGHGGFGFHGQRSHIHGKAGLCRRDGRRKPPLGAFPRIASAKQHRAALRRAAFRMALRAGQRDATHRRRGAPSSGGRAGRSENDRPP